MECEKCGDRGFTEQEHGLIMVLCDCEKGKAMMEELTGEATFPADNGGVTPPIKEKPEVIPAGQYWCAKCHNLHRVTSNIGKRHLKHQETEGSNDSSSGAG